MMNNENFLTILVKLEFNGLQNRLKFFIMFGSRLFFDPIILFRTSLEKAGTTAISTTAIGAAAIEPGPLHIT